MKSLHFLTLLNTCVLLSTWTWMLKPEKAKTFIENQIKPALGQETISEKLVNDEALLTLAMNGYDYASTDDLGNKWLVFINAACNDETSLPNFIAMANDINDLAMLSPWINVSFAQKIKGTSKALDVQNSLYQEFLTSKKDLITCKKLFQTITSFDPGSLEKPEVFETPLALLTKDIFEPLKENSFLQLVKNQNTPILTVFAITEIMKAAVDLFDSTIKTVKESTTYKNSEKNRIENILKIVNEYHEIFIAWSDLVQTKSDCLTQIKNAFETIKNNFDVIKNKTKDLSYFYEPSENFSANQSEPKTVDDVCVLLHQNLVTIINKLLVHYSVETPYQPSTLTNFKNELKKYISNLTTLFTGQSFSNGEITQTYSLPMHKGSGIMILKYTKETLWVTIHFLGNNNKEHWSDKLFYITILSHTNKIPLIESKLTQHELMVTLKITNESGIELLHKDINYLLSDLAHGQIEKSTETIDALHKRYKECFNQLDSQEKTTLMNTLSDFLTDNPCTTGACILFASLLIEQDLPAKEILEKLLSIKNQNISIIASVLTNKKLINSKKITPDLIESYIDKMCNIADNFSDTLESLDFIEKIISSQELIDANLFNEKDIKKMLFSAQKDNNLELVKTIITSEILIKNDILRKETIASILETLQTTLDEAILSNDFYYGYLDIFQNIILINKNFITKEYIDKIVTSALMAKNRIHRTRFLADLFSQTTIIEKKLISPLHITNFINSLFQDEASKKFIAIKTISQLLDRNGENLVAHDMLTEEPLKTIKKECKSHEIISLMVEDLLKKINFKK